MSQNVREYVMVPFDSRWLALEGHAFPTFQASIERERVVRAFG